MPQPEAFDWRTISALNTTSALAQVGQFGIAFVVLPVWLAQQGLDAAQLGLFAASLWLGQLPGLALAPWLSRRFGPRKVITAGLLCTLLALWGIAWLLWPLCLAGGMLAGFGLGLRWIGLEPWLYSIAPDHARGRLVGFHETLIALAPIVAPVLAGALGLQGLALFWVGSGFCLAALLPLALAAPAPAEPVAAAAVFGGGPLAGLGQAWQEPVFRQGVLVALLGGMMEAALSGLFALFAQGRSMAVGQIADLLALFGLGGLLLQYGVGWLADHRGVGVAARWCAVATALVAAVLAAWPLGPWLTGLAVFLLGGFITAFLTLALIASTVARAGSLSGNVSRISMLYTGSAVLGPLAAAAAMQASNGDALMWFTAAAAVLLALLLGRRAAAWPPQPT